MQSRPDSLNNVREAFERFTRAACDVVVRDKRLFAVVPRPWLHIEYSGGPESQSLPDCGLRCEGPCQQATARPHNRPRRPDAPLPRERDTTGPHVGRAGFRARGPRGNVEHVPSAGRRLARYPLAEESVSGQSSVGT